MTEEIQTHHEAIKNKLGELSAQLSSISDQLDKIEKNQTVDKRRGKGKHQVFDSQDKFSPSEAIQNVISLAKERSKRQGVPIREVEEQLDCSSNTARKYMRRIGRLGNFQYVSGSARVPSRVVHDPE